jgi:hypothetical protein
MKSLKPFYFTAGMTGMFCMAAPTQAEWLTLLGARQSLALIVALSLSLSSLLAWLTQFRRRYAGSTGLLVAFAACGLLVIGSLAAVMLDLLHVPALNIVVAIARLALFTLFSMVALQSRPASESAEGAL